jgi:RimJ/RimL family protein N-acetyltransferase
MKFENYQLTNKTIIIRPHRLSDVEACYSAVRESIDELSPWMHWCHSEISLHEIKDWIDSRPQKWENDEGYHFAIINSETKSFIGNCGLDHVDLQNRVAEIGYWVRKSCTREGIATCASKLVLDFAFHFLKLQRVEFIIAAKNIISQRVAEKLGAKREGLLRRRLNVRDIIYDAYVFSIIRDDLL